MTEYIETDDEGSFEGHVVTVTELPVGGANNYYNDTIRVFSGISDDGIEMTFGVDHRCAQEIIKALTDEDGGIAIVGVEQWQVLTSVQTDVS